MKKALLLLLTLPALVLAQSYPVGTELELTAVPNAGWEFSAWTGDAVGSQNPLSITLNADMSVTATFVQSQATLTVVTQGQGSVNVAVATGSTPDPTVFPLASGQSLDITAYNAMGVPSAASGFSYADPVTNATVWKATDASYPAPNIGAGHDYADGNVQATYDLGGGVHRLLVRLEDGAYWLVDFTRGVGFSNERLVVVQPDSASVTASFSKVPATAEILYVFDGTLLQRVDTATNTVANTGNFPKAMGPGIWLHQDRNDEWFVKLDGANAIAWNSQTDVLLSRPVSDEPRLSHNGQFVALSNGGVGAQIWDLTTDTIVATLSQYEFFHNASMTDYFVSINISAAGIPTYRVSGPTWIEAHILDPGFSSGHFSGHWIQDDPAGWVVGSDDQDFTGIGALLGNGLGMFRADGSDARLVAGAYSSSTPTYFAIPFATPSPDGKIIIFNSDQLGSGRHDLFVVEVPLN